MKWCQHWIGFSFWTVCGSPTIRPSLEFSWWNFPCSSAWILKLYTKHLLFARWMNLFLRLTFVLLNYLSSYVTFLRIYGWVVTITTKHTAEKIIRPNISFLPTYISIHFYFFRRWRQFVEITPQDMSGISKWIKNFRTNENKR